MATIISRRLAGRHEALVTRLDALLTETKPIARKSPGAAVPAAVRAAAEALLFDAQPFAARRQPGRPGFPEAAGGRPSLTWAALAVALAGLRATLETFEAAHAGWDDTHQCLAWRVQGDPLPIARLHRAAAPASRARPPELSDPAAMRAKVEDRINVLLVEAYDKGYAHAAGGHPRTPFTATIAGRIEQWGKDP